MPFLRFLFPTKCQSCQKPGDALCLRCIATIPLALPLPRDTYAVFGYGNGMVRSAIRNLKYHRRSESADALVHAAVPHILQLLSDRLQSLENIDMVLVPIPEHRRRLAMRGFNPAAYIARILSDALPTARVQSLLTKTAETPPQAKLNRARRLKNVVHTMECVHPLDPGSLYIIVDDVTTTGATFTEARRALQHTGAKKIISIALAH